MNDTSKFKRIEGRWPDVPDARRRVMQANKSTNTKPELILRRSLHKLGYRFRLHCRVLPGRPDLVFSSRKIAIQVHGCFWHQHTGCRHSHIPKSRQEYWITKLGRNVERDYENRIKLENMGWKVLTVWECDLKDYEKVIQEVVIFLGPTRHLK